jgi:putative oxidoreductase
MAPDLIALVGRLAMSAIFLWSGVLKAMAPAATMAAFARLHVPAVSFVYAVSLFIEIAVAVALAVGWKARPAALVLAGWCIATAFVAHYHPHDRAQMVNFMKNVCMAGGLLQVVAFGAGRLSLERR